MSFISAVEGFFQKLFGKAPSILQKASSAISYVAPLLKLVVADVDPSAAPEVNNILGEVETDIATTAAIISQSHSSSDTTAQAKVKTGIASISSNLSAILAAGHIKNTNLQNDITAGIGELQAVLGQLGS